MNGYDGRLMLAAHTKRGGTCYCCQGRRRPLTESMEEQMRQRDANAKGMLTITLLSASVTKDHQKLFHQQNRVYLYLLSMLQEAATWCRSPPPQGRGRCRSRRHGAGTVPGSASRSSGAGSVHAPENHRPGGHRHGNDAFQPASG